MDSDLTPEENETNITKAFFSLLQIRSAVNLDPIFLLSTGSETGNGGGAAAGLF